MTASISQKRLEAQIAAFRPDSILCIGKRAEAWAAAYRRRHPDCRVEARAAIPPLAALERMPRRDLALVGDWPATADHREVEQALSRLRDLGAERVIVALPAADWPPADLYALGFTRLGRLEAAPALTLYAFDIAAYKTTPDWLNSRYWAHPELWGKYWW